METIEEMVNELLQEIKNKMKQMGLDAEKVFLNGNCGNMYSILASYFPKKEVVPHIIKYDNNPYHIVTKIDGEFYDITGKTSLQQYIGYIQKNNPNSSYPSEKFNIEKIEIPDRVRKVGKMSNMYDYDNSFGQSLISNQMFQLEQHIKEFKESKLKEEQ